MMFSQGRYKATVTHQKLGESRNGTPQFVLSFRPIGKYDLERPGEELLPCEDWERSAFFYFSSRAVDISLEQLHEIGFRGTSFFELDPETPGFCDFGGLTIDVICEHEAYQGETKERWRLARTGGGGLEVKKLDDRQTRKLDALFGRKLKELAEKSSVHDSMQQVPTEPEPGQPKASEPVAHASEAEIEAAEQDQVPF